MKKFMLALGLILVLVCWGWQGYNGVGTAPAVGQPPLGYYCDPYYYNCTYDNYYSAPYADPATQFFYYTVPLIGGAIIRGHEREEFREHQRHERREFREHERHERRY